MVAAARVARSLWLRRPALSWSFVAALTVAAVVGALVLPAVGATTNLVPTAIATDQANWLSSSGTKFAAVTTQDTAYLYNATRNSTAEIVFDLTDIADIGDIASVTMYVRALDNGTRGLVATASIGGTSVGTLTPTLTASYPGTTPSIALTAPGGSWDHTEVSALRVGLKPRNSVNSTNSLRVDHVYFVVTYTAYPPTLVTLGDGSNDPGIANVAPGQAGVVVDQFTTRRTQGVKSPTLNTVTVTRTTGAPVSAVRIVADLNDNGVVDGSDFEVGSGTFDASLTSVVDVVPDQPVDGTARSYLVLYDIGSAATGGQTTTAQITAATFANADAAPTLSDDRGSAFTVVVAPTQVTIGDGPSIAGGHIQAGRANVPVNAFTLQRTSGSKSATISKITVNNTGTTPSATVTGVHIYRDTNSNGVFNEGVDVRLNTTPGEFHSPAVVTLDSPEPVDDTPDTYFVTYTFATTAIAGATANSEVGIAAADYANVDALVDNDTVTTSGSFTILAEGEEPPISGSPHAAYTTETNYCNACHVPHEAGSEQYILKFESAEQFTQRAFCYTCHDGGLAVNVKTGLSNASFQMEGTSGHVLEERGEDATPAADLTDKCASCHYAHADSTTRMRLPQETINGKTVTGANNSWCLACHDDAQSWWVTATTGRTKAQYDALIPAPSLNATGYPLLGTFPGATVYGTPAKNAHASIPAGSMDDWAMASREATRVAGDCLWCHSGHRGKSEYDGLVGKFGASTDQIKDTANGEYAEVCFTCHKTGGLVAAPDIASAALGDAADSGHTIRTAGARYPKGAPLPCYECHNPHGSTRNNTANISDALGQNLDPRDPADPLNVGASTAKVRAFCFSCHVTYDVDPVTSRPWAWDSGTGTYIAVSTTAKAIGLTRNVAVNVNDLRLPMANGHNKADTDRSCYECHGDVHKPMSGTSNGGVKCSVCHSALNGMVNDTNTYHHVLDAPDWDKAPGTYVGGVYGTTPYPTSKDELYCVSCHVDHSAYEPLPADDSRADGKGYSLRNDATVANPTPSNTDDTLCLSCHTEERARNTTGQKANAIQETNVWLIDPVLWGTSPHNYDSPGPFNDGSTFNANCAKCHGNLQGTLSSGKFSVHMSAEQRLLNALGDTVAINLAINEEQMCFRCHSETADFTANGGSLPGIPKPADNKDWYGTQDMSESNVVIYAQMTSTANTNGHRPHLYSNKHRLSEVDEPQTYISSTKHVECADCHNHHVVGDARHEWGTTNDVSEAIQGVTGQQFSAAALTTLSTVVGKPTDAQINNGLTWMGAANGYATKEYAICFKCHSSENTNLATWGGTKAGAVTQNRWTNVAAEFSVGNQSRHPVLAPNDAYTDTTTYGTSRVAAGQLSGIWAPGDTMYCSDCHGDSTAPLAGDADNLNHAQGPHGSSVPYSLRGPNTSWPANKAGTLWTINMVISAVQTPGAELPFCSNCHLAISTNSAHNRNNLHKGGPCIQCHILIPHGGAMSRLIGDGNGSMPARYAYNNDKSTMKVGSFRKRNIPTDYQSADCTVTSTSGCTGGAKHSTTDGTAANGYENW